MKSILLSTAASLMIASAAFAGDDTVEKTDKTASALGPVAQLTGGIEVDVAENAAGDYAATTTFEAGLVASGLAFGEVGIESVDGSTFEVNKWYVGTYLGPNATLSFGDHDGGIFIESYSDFSTIADPSIGEALIVGVGQASLAVGFTDISTDISDVSNVQGAYAVDLGVGVAVASADYNLDSEDYALGLRAEGLDVAGIGLGSTVSYQSSDEVIAYEVDATLMGLLTTYVNGDSDDALRNVGAGYERDMNGLTFATDVNYDVDTEEFTPSATISFNF